MTQRTKGSGYPKGDDTRDRLLAAALHAFGDRGYAAATTRQIAAAANTSLPNLRYYFGDKEGLYLACAEEVAARFRRRNADVAQAAVVALSGPLTPAEARGHLGALMRGVAAFMLADEEATGSTLFVQREIADQGPAFELLAAEIWRPGTELAAALIARALGEPATTDDARVRAILLIASLTGLQTGRHVIDQVFERRIEPAELSEHVSRIIDLQIAQLS